MLRYSSRRSTTLVGTNLCRYKLEGSDLDWNEGRCDRRQAAYTPLPGGRYTFRVQGATSTSAWSEIGVALRIDLAPVVGSMAVPIGLR